MSIIHIKKREHPYVQIDKRCLADKRLSWRARGVLAYLLSKPTDWIVCVKDLENMGLEGRDAVQNALKELQKVGYAKLETSRGEDGRLLGKRWIVCEEPTNGFSGNWQDTDELKNRPTGKPFNGKSAPTNNDSLSDFTNNDLEEEKAASPFPLPENEKQTFGEEKKETPPPSSAPPPPLIPPFTPTGETIEPKPATLVRLYDPQVPAVTIVDSVPGEYRPETPYKRVNIGEEITRLKTDELAKETFALVRKIPSNLFSEYVEAFEKEIGGTGETYPNQPAFRKHFFNWSECRHEKSQRKATIQNGKRSSLNAAGGDLSKYEEKQRF